MLLQVTWDVDPVMFHLGPLTVVWYGLLFALAFVFGYYIMDKYIFKYEKMPENEVDRLATYVVIATVIGARLGHVLFYEPEYYLANPLKILKIWEGGLASHGAAIAIVIAIWLYARRSSKSFLWVIDRLVIVVALGGFFIRMGNLMNSEIYGDATSLPWGFIFVRDGQTVPKHPTQIYEALSYLLLFFGLFRYYRRNYKTLPEGLIFGIFLVVLFGVRFLIEFIKEPQVGFEENMVLNMGQLLSIPFILAGIWFIYRAKTKPQLTHG